MRGGQCAIRRDTVKGEFSSVIDKIDRGATSLIRTVEHRGALTRALGSELLRAEISDVPFFFSYKTAAICCGEVADGSCGRLRLPRTSESIDGSIRNTTNKSYRLIRAHGAREFGNA